MSTNCVRLHPVSFGLAFGILWGAATLLVGILAFAFGWGGPFVNVLGSLYVGYEPTILGSLVGGVWGLIDGFIGGFILAWLYNLLAKKCIGSCE